MSNTTPGTPAHYKYRVRKLLSQEGLTEFEFYVMAAHQLGAAGVAELYDWFGDVHTALVQVPVLQILGRSGSGKTFLANRIREEVLRVQPTANIGILDEGRERAGALDQGFGNRAVIHVGEWYDMDRPGPQAIRPYKFVTLRLPAVSVSGPLNFEAFTGKI